MKNDAVSLTSERIISIIKDHKSKSKQTYIQVALQNVGDCKGTKMRLRLLIREHFDGIVSDCLSPDEIGKIHEIVRSFCEQSNVNTEYFKFR